MLPFLLFRNFKCKFSTTYSNEAVLGIKLSKIIGTLQCVKAISTSQIAILNMFVSLQLVIRLASNFIV